MIKIVIGGQMGKEEIKKDLLELIGDEEVDIEIKNDLDAAMTIQDRKSVV